MRETALNFNEARTVFLEPNIKKYSDVCASNTIIYIALSCLAIVNIAWKSKLYSFNLSKISLASVDRISLIGSIISIAFCLFGLYQTKKINDTINLCFKPLNENLRRKFPEQSLDGDLLRKVFLLLSNDSEKTQFINRLNFKQLTMLKAQINFEDFKRLLSQLDSTRNRGVAHWQLILKLVAASREEIRDEYLPKLAALSHDPLFPRIAYIINQELAREHKILSVHDLLQAIPFLKNLDLHSADGRMTFCIQKILFSFRNGAIEISNDRYMIADSTLPVIFFRDRIQIISDIYFGKPQTLHLSQDDEIRIWQEALQFAVSNMSDKIITEVERHFETLSLDYTLDHVNLLIQGYERANYNSPILEDLKQKRAVLSA